MSTAPAWPCSLHSNVLYHPSVANSYVVSCNTNYPGNDLLFLHADTSVLSVSASSNMHSVRRQGYEIGQEQVTNIGQLAAGSDSVTSTITATDSVANTNAPSLNPTPTAATSQASSTAVVPAASVLQPTQSTSSTTVVIYQAAPSASSFSSATSPGRSAVALALSSTHVEPVHTSTSRPSPSITRIPMSTSSTSPTVTIPTAPTPITSISSSAPSSTPSFVPEMQPQTHQHQSSGTSLALKLGLAISLSSFFILALLSSAVFMYFRHRHRYRISIPQQLPFTTLPALYPIPPPVPPPKNDVFKPRSMYELGATPVEPVPPLAERKRPRTLAKAELEASGTLDIKAMAELPGWRESEWNNALENEKHLEIVMDKEIGKSTNDGSSFYRNSQRSQKRDYAKKGSRSS